MVDPRYLLSAAFFDKQFQVQVHVRVTVARYHKFYFWLVDRRYRPVNRLIGLQSARLFRLADKNIEIGTHIRWFLSHGGAVTTSDYEKLSLFYRGESGISASFNGAFARRLPLFLGCSFSFLDLRATRDVDRRLRLRPRPVILVPRF